MTTLPPGTHPQDPSVLAGRVDFAAGPPVPLDTAQGPPATGRRPWAVDNPEALGVFMRAAATWSANTITLSRTLQIIGRQRGRTHVSLWVPSSAAAGVIVAPTEGEVDSGDGVTLYPGDSLAIYSEAPIYGGVIIGQASGTVAVVAYLNPAGSLGAD